jgi:hypothetical protein
MSRKNYSQGIYTPKNPEKYIGRNHINFRSSWEYKFCHFCDSNDRILQWNSESITIDYIDPADNKWHRYYPDFLIKLVDKNGQVKTLLIEIKPIKETVEPKRPKKISKSYVESLNTYHKNQAKWDAARIFCKKNDIEFQILTEQDLGV